MINELQGDNPTDKARNKLRDKGYLVEITQSVKPQLVNFFECWSLIAINKTHTRFVRVEKTPFYSQGVACKRKLKEFPLPLNTSKEYWYYTDGYFKVKFISDGKERNKGNFFHKVRKSWSSEPKIEQEEVITEIEYSEDLPF